MTPELQRARRAVAPGRSSVRVAPGAVQAPRTVAVGSFQCRRATMAQAACARSVRPNTLPNECMSCRLRDFGLTVGLAPTELDELDDAVTARRKVAAGQTLYAAGDALRHVYAVRLGTFKTALRTADGREQITGFQLQGELLGIGAVGLDRHLTDAVALEDSDVWMIPYARLIDVGQRFPRVSHNLQRVLSQEVSAAQSTMLLLGRMSAEERMAAFLLNLGQRYAALGWSGTEYTLRMSREDIANYLGIKLETVSRMLGRLQERGLVEIRQRQVRILDACALERVFDASVSCAE